MKLRRREIMIDINRNFVINKNIMIKKELFLSSIDYFRKMFQLPLASIDDASSPR